MASSSYYQHQRLGGQPFNAPPDSSAEQEYDRLRDLARKEQGQHQHFAAQAQHAYERGDGSGAHEASQQSKVHAAQADAYNRQASEFIFRTNNAVGKVGSDTIDLHGQFVEEAEEILEQRIRHATQAGQSHLHVIVGKGNHSPDHVQKIKPRVEQVCRELGLQYHTEPNAGRLYIELQPGGGGGGGGGGHHAPPPDHAHQPQHPQYGQPHYETAYPLGTPPRYGYHQQDSQMHYGDQNQHLQAPGQTQYPGRPQQGMQVQEAQQDDGIKCCGIKICVVM